jgi:hypothetical protein
VLPPKAQAHPRGRTDRQPAVTWQPGVTVKAEFTPRTYQKRGDLRARLTQRAHDNERGRSMNVADDLRPADGYTVYRPAGECTLETAAAIVMEAIRECGQRKVQRLLIDITGLRGFKPPSTFQRYQIASAWAYAAGPIRIAFVFRPDILDPQRFGMTVAQNRGMSGEVFLDESEAVGWLLAA